jgi:hypothetical protein
VYVASVLILMGGAHSTPLLVVGGALIVVTFAISLWLAFGHHDAGPRPRWFWWALGVGAGAYVLMAVGAAADGWQYAVAALLAGVVPLTALSLTLAMLRKGILGDPREPPLARHRSGQT